VKSANTISLFIEKRALEFDRIDGERKKTLSKIAFAISEELKQAEELILLFICTHNSRRSQYAQIWSKVAAHHYSLPIRSLSGGTEKTKVYPQIIETLRETGFKITPAADKTQHLVAWNENIGEIALYSKAFPDVTKSLDRFFAIMVCSEADQACPFVPGASARFSLPYEDPKISDGTQDEEKVYKQRSNEIAQEMVFLMREVRNRV
jgi:arsenate reductase